MEENENDAMCIARECLEEAGYRVKPGIRVCSAEAFVRHPAIGYFHPIQTYYVGELMEKVQMPVEKDHTFLWVDYEKIRGNLCVEMQNWALEQCIKLLIA